MQANVELITANDQEQRSADIRAVTLMAKTARDDTARLGLKFEAYLLDMAVLALAEHLER